MFDSLQQMAKMDGEGQGVAAEDKDQLNYHVIIIGLYFSLHLECSTDFRTREYASSHYGLLESNDSLSHAVCRASQGQVQREFKSLHQARTSSTTRSTSRE